MEQIELLRPIKDKQKNTSNLRGFMYKIGNTLEVIVFLAVWIMIFSTKGIVGDFTRTEMITYIIFGNIIGLLSGHFLHQVIAREAYQKKSGLLIYRPIRYFFNVLIRGMGKSLVPFFIVFTFQFLIFIFLKDNFTFNYDPRYWLLIGIMITLAFITEFLLVYIVSLSAHWIIEAGEFYKIIVRIKKFLSGNYFPLSLLPLGFLQISLAMPFAYSFFVPTELFLKKISLSEGWRGVFIQMSWIMLLYITIKIFWKKKRQKEIAGEQ